MRADVEIWLPVPPAVFGVFLGVVLVYVVYVGAKFVISLWTGA